MEVDILSAGTIFLFVLAGHLLGDFVVQTDWQASNKEKDWNAMYWHVLGYTSCMAILLIGADPTKVWTLLGISAATHVFIDRRWPVRWLLRHTRSPWFADQLWGVLCVDQALHISILAITTGVLWG